MGADYTVTINLDEAEVIISLVDKFKVTIEEEGVIEAVLPSASAAGNLIKESFTAGESIGGQRIVTTFGGVAFYFDPSDETNAGRQLGISNNAGALGEDIDVILSGIVKSSGWGLTQDAVYYASANGLISTTPAASGIDIMIGYAIDADTLKLEFSEPIILV